MNPTSPNAHAQPCDCQRCTTERMTDAAAWSEAQRVFGPTAVAEPLCEQRRRMPAGKDILGREWKDDDVAKREAVISCLSYTGDRYDKLTGGQHLAARTLADGFGRSANPEILWDWSHVRDSSPSAVAAMYAYLKREGLLT